MVGALGRPWLNFVLAAFVIAGLPLAGAEEAFDPCARHYAELARSPAQLAEWKRISVRDPSRELLDPEYLENLHASVRESFAPWFEKGEGDFAAMLKQQHRTMVSGKDGSHVYFGASRRGQNLERNFQAVPGEFRHEIFTKNPDAQWTVQIKAAEELGHRFSGTTGKLREDYLARLKAAGQVEPAEEKDFLDWIRRKGAVPPGEATISLAGLSPEHWPKIEVYGNYIRHHYARHADVPLFLDATKRLMEEIRATKVQTEADLSHLLDLLSDYTHLGGNSHLFNMGNFSLTMSHVNYVLAKNGLKGISHGNLDYQAMTTDFEAFRRVFREAVLAVNPALKVLPPAKMTTNRAFASVVIPTYRELDNGNLLRLLDSFSRQKDRRFELVFLFDNPKELSTPKGDLGALENARSIELLDYLGGRTSRAPDFLARYPAETKAKIEALRDRHMEIRTHFLSLEAGQRNIGRIRDVGVQSALDRARRAEVETAVAMMDADNTVPPNYVESILGALKDPKTDSLILPLSFKVEPGSVPDLYQSTFSERYWFAWEQLNAALVNRPQISVAGSQIVGTSKAIERVGGVPHLYKHEDLELAKKLAEKGGMRVVDGSEVINADRARPQGFIAARRFRELNSGEQWGWLHPHIDPRQVFLGEMLEKAARRGAKDAEGEIRDAFAFLGLPFDQGRWRNASRSARGKEAVEAYFGKPNQSIDAVKPDEILLDFLSARLPKRETALLEKRLQEVAARHERDAGVIEAYIRGLASGESPAKLAAMPSEFLDGNTWIVGEVQRLRGEGKSAEEILGEFREHYPDWLQPFASTPLKKRVIQMNVLAKFLYEARNHPEELPGAHALLQRIESGAP